MKRWVFASVFIVLFFSSFFFCSNFASADIVHPYVVDEKPQVQFGDSANITVVGTSTSGELATTTYLGLENYKQDYVNGFTHFTFTYTHTKNFYAGYPPLIYLTNVDPRTTSTSTEKIFFPVLDAPSLYWYGATDWYLVDIQFDATGFTIIIKEAGTDEIWNEHTTIPDIIATDWVALANRYPFDSASPPNIYTVAFTPVPISEIPPTQTIDPVIIIPGIMGSAPKNGKLVIDPILHTYDDLIATLRANGYTEGKDLFTFPYEWRDSNVLSANLLKDKINEVKTICNCQKVDLVAHSMGGLVAREYIQSDQYQHDVDQVIFLGTPHKGSPKAYLQWEAGEFPPGRTSDTLIKLFFETEALEHGYGSLFNYIQNRPISSVQELLPTFDYLEDKDTGVLRTYPSNYPKNTFLEYLNNDVSKLLNSGVKITNIVSDVGENSTTNIIRVTSSTDSLWADGKPDGFDNKETDRGLKMGDGDGTVTINSATLDPSIQNEIWTNVEHQELPKETEARIFNILIGKIASTTIFLTPIEKIFSIQLQSPVDMLIIAPDGKRMGKNFETGEEYNEIPGAFYSGYQTDEEYITIPNPLDGEYKIEVQGTGNGGKFGVVTNYISENNDVSKEYSDTIKPGEIKETSVITSGTKSNLSLEIKTKEGDISSVPLPELTSNPILSSKSGSGHHEMGEVLGASTTLSDQMMLQIKLISCLNELVRILHLYMLKY